MTKTRGVLTGKRSREDGSVINEADYLFDNTDAFGKATAKNYKNVADIASHYNHSPERHRLFINGTRFLLQYGTTPKFEDTADSYILKPAAGDVIEYRTAERFRYVVNYILEASTAFRVNKKLQGDDKIVMGMGDLDLANDMANANGWFREWRGGDNGNECYLTTYRDGESINPQKATLVNQITDWQRIEDQINWYNVGNRVARETYTRYGEQFNPIVGQTSVDGAKGPSRGNFPFVFGIKADDSTTGLELETGSLGINVLGDVDPVFRVKESSVTESHSGGGQWEPLFAVRRDPNNANVFINLSDIKVAEVSADGDIEVLALAVDPSKTDASNFVTPVYHSNTNSAIKESTGDDVTTFPDSTGAIQTAADNPGGFQLGFTAYYTAGTGTANRRSTTTSGVRKRAISNGDYVVFLGKSSTAMDVTINYETEQQY